MASSFESNQREHEPGRASPAAWEAAWNDLVSGRCDTFGWRHDHGCSADAAVPPAPFLLPGSFNPIHNGHRSMANWVQRTKKQRVGFELSIDNVDKPSLECHETWKRIARFPAESEIWLTRAPRFVDKSALFPGSIFVVGADTIARIASAKYYADGGSDAQVAVERIVSFGCRFLVFGRAWKGQFADSAAALQLPKFLAEHCEWVDESQFREDISSTELRSCNGPDHER